VTLLLSLSGKLSTSIYWCALFKRHTMQSYLIPGAALLLSKLTGKAAAGQTALQQPHHCLCNYEQGQWTSPPYMAHPLNIGTPITISSTSAVLETTLSSSRTCND
jgi:hypothetical protein